MYIVHQSLYFSIPGCSKLMWLMGLSEYTRWLVWLCGPARSPELAPSCSPALWSPGTWLVCITLNTIYWPKSYWPELLCWGKKVQYSAAQSGQCRGRGGVGQDSNCPVSWLATRMVPPHPSLHRYWDIALLFLSLFFFGKNTHKFFAKKLTFLRNEGL